MIGRVVGRRHEPKIGGPHLVSRMVLHERQTSTGGGKGILHDCAMKRVEIMIHDPRLRGLSTLLGRLNGNTLIG